MRGALRAHDPLAGLHEGTTATSTRRRLAVPRALTAARQLLSSVLPALVLATGLGALPVVLRDTTTIGIAGPKAPPADRVPLSGPGLTGFWESSYPGNPLGGLPVYDVAIGDFNGDGTNDIAGVVDRNDARGIGVSFNDGSGTWTAPTLLPVTAAGATQLQFTARGITAADFDQDGDVDIVASVVYRGVRLLSFINQGDGTFKAGASTPLPSVSGDNPTGQQGSFDAFGLGAADMNGDGRPDLLTSPDAAYFDGLSGTLALLTTPAGAWDGSFASPALFDATDAGNVNTADVDGDGRLDLIGIGYDRSGLWWRRNLVGTPGGPTAFAGNKYAGDPAGSAAVAESGFGPRIAVAVPRASDYTYMRGIGVSYADVTGDGVKDFVIIRQHYDTPGQTSTGIDLERPSMRVLPGTGPGQDGLPTFGPGTGDQAAAGANTYDNGVGSYSTPPFDADGDGDLDVIVPAGWGESAIARNDGHGAFTLESYVADPGARTDRFPSGDAYPGARGGYAYGPGSNVPVTRAADIDGDGRPDLVSVMNGDAGGVTTTTSIGHASGDVYRGARAVTTGLPLNAAYNARSVAKFDWDGDGKTDLLAPGGPTGAMVSKNNGRGGFDLATSIGGAAVLSGCAPSQQTQLLVGDVDHDGTPDLICGGLRGVTVGFGDGHGGLAAFSSATFPSPYFNNSTDFQAVDLDGDSTLEIATVVFDGGGNWAFSATKLGENRVLGAPTVGVTLARYNNYGAVGLQVGNFDKDAGLEAVVVGGALDDTNPSNGGHLQIQTWQVSGTTLTDRTNGPDLGHAQFVEGITAADLDKDGDLDLVGRSGNAISVLKNDGNGGFTRQSYASPGFSNNRAELFDIDHDGNLDVISNTYGSLGNYNTQYEVEILFGNGDATFAIDRANRMRLPTAVGNKGVAGIGFFDTDSDGRSDVVIARSQTPDTPPSPNVVVLRDLGGASARLPDLAATNVTVSGAATIPAGETRTVTATIENLGLSSAPSAGSTAFYLSSDLQWSPDDRVLGVVPAPAGPVAPGSTKQVVLTAPIVPSAPGEQHVLARVDTAQAVTESDEQNLSAANATITVDVPALVIGRANAVTVPVGQARYYRIDSGQALSLRTDRPDAAIVDVVRGSLPVPARQLQIPGTGVVALPSGTGPWFVRVEARPAGATAGNQAINLTPNVLEFGALTSAPGRGSNLGTTTLTIDGRGLDGATVKLGTLAPVSATVLDGGNRIVASFDLRGQAVGNRDVVVTKGGQTSTLPNAFVVTTTPAGGLELFVDLPGRLRAGLPVGGLIQYRNSGDTDVPAAFVKVSSDVATLRVNGGAATKSTTFWTDAEGVAPGIVPAGKTVAIPVEVTTGGDFRIDVDSLEPGDPAPSGRGVPTIPIPTDPAVAAAVDAAPAGVREAIRAGAAAQLGGSVTDLLTRAAFLRANGRTITDLDGIVPATVDEAIAHLGSAAPVSGTLTRSGAASVGGSVLRAHTPGGPGNDATQTGVGVAGVDGSFALLGSPAVGHTTSVVGARVTGGATVVAGPNAVTADDGLALVVQARKPGGAALAGARVGVIDATGEVHRATTSSDGRATVTGLAAGAATITATADDLAEARGAATLPAAAPVVLDFAALGTITGRIADAVEGAYVVAHPHGSSLTSTSAVSGSASTRPDGTFSLRVPVGSYDLLATEGDRAWSATVAAPSSDVVLGAAAPIARKGTITDQLTKQPIVGATVKVTDVVGVGASAVVRTLATTTTGTGGTYELPDAPGIARGLAVSALGHADAVVLLEPSVVDTVTDVALTTTAVATSTATPAEAEADDARFDGPPAPAPAAAPSAPTGGAAAASVSDDLASAAALGGECKVPAGEVDDRTDYTIRIGGAYADTLLGYPLWDGVPTEVWGRYIDTGGSSKFTCWGVPDDEGVLHIKTPRWLRFELVLRSRGYLASEVTRHEQNADFDVATFDMRRGKIVKDKDPVVPELPYRDEFWSSHKLPTLKNYFPLDYESTLDKNGLRNLPDCPAVNVRLGSLREAIDAYNELLSQQITDLLEQVKQIGVYYGLMFTRVVAWVGETLSNFAEFLALDAAAIPLLTAGAFAGIINVGIIAVRAVGAAMQAVIDAFLRNLVAAVQGAVAGEVNIPATIATNMNALVSALISKFTVLEEKTILGTVLSRLANVVAELFTTWDTLDSLKSDLIDHTNLVKQLKEGIKTRENFLDGVLDDILRLINELKASKELRDPCDQPPTKRRKIYGVILRASDPNDITGPGGAGPDRYLVPGGDLSYQIDVENVGPGTEHPNGAPVATAPAAKVAVTETLDTDLDPATFTFGPMSIGVAGADYPKIDFTPAAGSQAFSETKRVTVPVYGTDEDPVAIDVRATASLAPDTGVVSWVFEALDPKTGLTPADPLVGLLPPEPVTPEGMGHGSVQYTVRAKPGLTTGTAITAQARVVFDSEGFLDTPVWSNKVDVDAPQITSAVLGAGPSVPVSWDATDLGSGVDVFDVFVADLGHTGWVPWKVGTTARSATYLGQAGHTYAFGIRASDLVGNTTSGFYEASAAGGPVVNPPNPPGPSTPVVDLGPRLIDLSFRGGRRPYPNGTVTFLIDLQAAVGQSRPVLVLKRTAAATRRRPERFMLLGNANLDAYGDGRFTFRYPKPKRYDVYVIQDTITRKELYRTRLTSALRA